MAPHATNTEIPLGLGGLDHFLSELPIIPDLGVNYTFVFQFVIVVAMFILAKIIFLDKLQFVIETREENTVKRENSAEEKFEAIDKLSNEYKDKLSVANKSATAKVNEQKATIIKKYDSTFKSKEKEINEYIDSMRIESENDIESKKDGVLAEADQLSNSLLSKFTRS